MKVMPGGGNLVADARAKARLSQAELARLADVAQSAIARLESGNGNPTLATLTRVLAAAGFELHCELMPIDPADPVVDAYLRDVDRTMIRENLKRSIDDRLRMNEDARALGDELQRAVRARRGTR